MMIVLRLLHVITGVFWAGAVFFAVSFLFGSIRDAGPAGNAVARQLIGVRQYPKKIFIIALIAVISGFALYAQNVSMSEGAFARSRAGMVYGLGGVAAVLTLVAGMVIMTPTSSKMGALGAAIQAGGGTPSPEQAAEMARLQAKMTMGSRIAATLLLVVVITMAIARYM
jgi:succinate dehydrogenase/fumarate reductase cytochrome b subunit